MVYDFGNFKVERLITGRWKENCYLLVDQESADLVIIDPGSDIEMITSRLEKLGGRVRHILLTHGHHDHLGAASELCESMRLPCSVHKDDVPLLRRAPIYSMAFEKRMITIPRDLAPFDVPQQFRLGKSSIEAWLTPGHTPGSICLHFGECVFTGDTLLRESVGRTDLPGGNGHQLGRSIEFLLSGLTEQVVLLPGHGDPWSPTEAQDWWERSHSIRPEISEGTP